MDIDEIRGKDSDELRQELDGLHREAFKLRMQKGTGQLSRPNQFKVVRRAIARIKTVLTERRNEVAK